MAPLITVLGIDPGQKDTGAVLRRGNECLGVRVISHQGWDTRAVIDELWNFTLNLRAESGMPLVAVEGVKQPTGFRDGKKQPINWMPLLCTAAVLGAVFCTWPESIVVPPGGNGKAPLRTYPPDLVGARETTGTGGRMQHARSAWDVAGQVPRLLRYGTLPGGRPR